MNLIKLSLYNHNKVVIENYNNIIELSTNKITIDNYYIEGNDLKIKQIEEYFIIIVGNILQIKINCDNL